MTEPIVTPYEPTEPTPIESVHSHEEPVSDVQEPVEPAPAADEAALSSVLELKARQSLESLQTALQEFETSIGDVVKSEHFLVLPSSTRRQLEALAAVLPKIDPEANPDKQAWAENIATGLLLAAGHGDNDVLEPSVERDGSEWRQTVTDKNGERLQLAKPRYSHENGQVLSGEQAVFRIRQALGHGTTVSIPLWHSGFWVTVKAPGEAALIALDYELAALKINLGRQTHGAMFSNQQVVMAGNLLRVILDHVYDTTLTERDNNKLLSKISQLDLPVLVWGFALAVYGNGYNYERGVIGADGTRDRVIQDRINLGKIHWTDYRSLSDVSVAMMSRRGSALVTDELQAQYQAALLTPQRRTVKFKNDIEMDLVVPTVEQYLESGQRWISQLTLETDRVLGMNADDKARNRYLFRTAEASILRNYNHWVKEIRVGPTDNQAVIRGDDIDKTLAELSIDKELAVEFRNQIQDFINDATLSLIAVPAVTEQEENKLPRWPRLLPIDPIATFFTLLGQRLS